LARWFVENQIGMPLSYSTSFHTPRLPIPNSTRANYGFSKVVRATPPSIETLHCMLHVSSRDFATNARDE
jgi:hypothetical protein